MRCYPSDKLSEEVAYLAYHLHWSYDQIMNMEHHERLQWVNEVVKINQRLNEMTSERSLDSWR